MSSNVAFRSTVRFPSSLADFYQQFPDDEACAAFLEKLHWPKGFVCPRCGRRSEPMRLCQRPELLHCTQCGGNVSLIEGTMMSDRMVPLSLWFLASFLHANSLRDIGSHQLCARLESGHHEALHQALALLRRRMIDAPQTQIGGLRSCGHVEVAGASITYDSVDGCGKACVAAAVEVLRGSSGSASSQWNANCAGRMRLEIVPNTNPETICAFVESVVHPDAAVFTLAGGNGGTIKADSGGEAPGMELVRLVLSSLACWCCDYTDVTGLPAIGDRVSEFAFRFNRYFDTFAIFQSLLGIEVETPTPLYREISLNEWMRSAAGAGR
jgi:hypothetical protein